MKNINVIRFLIFLLSSVSLSLSLFAQSGETDPIWTAAKSAATVISGSWDFTSPTIHYANFIGINDTGSNDYNNMNGGVIIQGAVGWRTFLGIRYAYLNPVLTTNAYPNTVNTDSWVQTYSPYSSEALELDRNGNLNIYIAPPDQPSGTFSSFWGTPKVVATQDWSSSQFPTKSGSGATGIWGINISGNAETATSATLINEQTPQWTTTGSTIYSTNSGDVGIGTNNPTGKLTVDYSNGDPKSLSIFSSSTDPANSPVGGLRFSWYGDNYADIQMVRGNNAIDGLGLAFLTSASDSRTTTEAMRITQAGNVGIGTSNPQSKLAVNGTVTATEVKVTQTGWSDFVFDPAYRLPKLSATATYIKANHHLPDIPSAKEIESKGLNLGDMEKRQMQKIEELTLYQINADKKITQLEKELSELKNEVEQLKNESR